GCPVAVASSVAPHLAGHGRVRPPYPASNSPTGLARGQTSGDLLSLNNAQLSRRTPAGSRPHTPGLLQVLPNRVAVPAHASVNHGCRLAAAPPFPDFGLLSCCVVGPTRHQHLHVHGVPAGPPSLNRWCIHPLSSPGGATYQQHVKGPSAGRRPFTGD